MKAFARGLTTIAVVAIGFLMVFILPAGSVAAASPATVGATSTLWSYGAVRTFAASGTTADGWAYHGQATFGYSVILNQTNTSASGTTFELSIDRTMGVLFSLEACFPSCAAAVDAANFTYHSWEQSDAWANFTNAGYVTQGSTLVPAIALQNSQAVLHGRLVENSSSTIAGIDRSKYLSVNVSAADNVSFLTPLGLIPLDLSLNTPASWTNSSAFNATGGSAWNFYYGTVGPLGESTKSLSGTTSVTGTGTVTAIGSYTLGDTVTFGGVSYPAIELTIEGPFSVREGVILVPPGADLFSTATQPWSANNSGAATVTMTNLDALPHADGHFGLIASAWLYDTSASVDTTDVQEATTASSGLSPAVESVSPAPPTSIQGAPENVADAQSSQSCLVSGTGCPAAAKVASPSHFLMAVLVLGLIAVVIAAIVSAVLMAERRRMPPPVYPNASLYPPGASGEPARPVAPRAPGQPPPPDEDDPLGNLW